MNRVQKVAIITSGGEGSGINQVIQALCFANDLEIWGFHGGFDGIVEEKGFLLTKEDCKGCVISGRQLVRSARSKRTFLKAGRQEIISTLKKMELECLIVCGGNGSLEGAKLITQEGFPTIFIPMSIDNDIDYSDYSIGYDSAVNEYLKILQDIHNSASNMANRIFMLEVPGGNCGQLALACGVIGGADIVILPEYSIAHSHIVKLVNDKWKAEPYLILICAETAYEKDTYIAGGQGISFAIGKKIEKETGVRMRHTITGFYARGSQPCYQDCYVAAGFAELAMKAINSRRFGIMVGMQKGGFVELRYEEHHPKVKALDKALVEIALKKNMLVLEEEL